MIWFQTKQAYPEHDLRPNYWIPIPLGEIGTRGTSAYNFEYCNYKINDTIFSESSDDFFKALEQVKMWEQLQA